MKAHTKTTVDIFTNLIFIRFALLAYSSFKKPMPLVVRFVLVLSTIFSLVTQTTSADVLKPNVVYLYDGSTAQLVQKNGHYRVQKRSLRETDIVDGFIYDNRGNVQFVFGNKNQVTLTRLQDYTDYGATSKLEAKYLNSLDMSATFDRELISRLTLGKVAFLKNGGKLSDWQYFVGNNVGLGSGDLKMSHVLEKSQNLARWLLKHGAKIHFINMFDEKEKVGAEFLSIVQKTNVIIDKKAESAKYQAESAKYQAESAKYQKITAKNRAESAKNEKITAKNEATIAKNEATIAKNRAIINAYKNVLGGLAEHEKQKNKSK